MSRRYSTTSLIVLVTVIGLSVLLAYNRLAMPVVHPHVGDGHFENHSWRFPWPYFGVPIPGYEIGFREFDLSSGFDATYHIEQLPQLSKHLGVYLSISDSNRKWCSDESREQLVARVEFDVYDDDGELVCHVQQRLADMVWASPEGSDYGLYDLDESFFVPRAGGRYTLRIRYSPDSKLSGLKGFVHIRCGGSI